MKTQVDQILCCEKMNTDKTEKRTQTRSTCSCKDVGFLASYSSLSIVPNKLSSFSYTPKMNPPDYDKNLLNILNQ